MTIEVAVNAAIALKMTTCSAADTVQSIFSLGSYTGGQSGQFSCAVSTQLS